MEREKASPDTAREKRNSSSSDSSSSTENNDTDNINDNSDYKNVVYELELVSSGTYSRAVDGNAALNSSASARVEPRVTADSEGGSTATEVESDGSKRIVENGSIPTVVASSDDDDGISQVMIRPRSDIVASAASTRSSGNVTPAQRQAAGLLGKLGLSLHVDSVVVRKRARSKVVSEGELHSEIGKLISDADENTDNKDNSQHKDKTEDGSNEVSAVPVTVQQEKHSDQETVEKDISIEQNEEKNLSKEDEEKNSAKGNEEKDDSTEQVEEKDDSSDESEDKGVSDIDESSLDEDITDNVSNHGEGHRETFPDSVNETVENKSKKSNKGCCCIL